MARLQEATGDDTFSVRYSDAVRAVLTRFPVGLPKGGPVRVGQQWAAKQPIKFTTVLGLTVF